MTWSCCPWSATLVRPLSDSQGAAVGIAVTRSGPVSTCWNALTSMGTPKIRNQHTTKAARAIRMISRWLLRMSLRRLGFRRSPAQRHPPREPPLDGFCDVLGQLVGCCLRDPAVEIPLKGNVLRPSDSVNRRDDCLADAERLLTLHADRCSLHGNSTQQNARVTPLGPLAPYDPDVSAVTLLQEAGQTSRGRSGRLARRESSPASVRRPPLERCEPGQERLLDRAAVAFDRRSLRVAREGSRRSPGAPPLVVAHIPLTCHPTGIAAAASIMARDNPVGGIGMPPIWNKRAIETCGRPLIS
jgi:hypothetical protein